MTGTSIIRPPRSTPDERAGWRVVAAAYCGAAVSFGSLLIFTFSVFLKPLSEEFHWSREAVSAAFGYAALTVAACSPVLGHWLDRYPARRIIVPCMIVYGLAFASLGLLTSNLARLYATFVLIGAVGNGTTQMGYSRAVASWFDRRRGLALALVMAGVGTGAIVWPPLAVWLIAHNGWRAAYFTLGAIVLLLGVPLTALFVRERPRAHITTTEPVEGISVREALRRRPFWILVSTLLVGSMAVNGAIAHFAALLTDRGLGASAAAIALSTLGVASLAGRLLTGVLLDRFFGPRIGFTMLAVTAFGIALLATAHSTALALAAAACIGFGLGAEADVTPFLLTRYFGLRPFATLYGYTWTAYALAGATGPVVMGYVYDHTGGYFALLGWLAVTTLVSATLFLALPAYHQTHATPQSAPAEAARQSASA